MLFVQFNRFFFPFSALAEWRLRLVGRVKDFGGGTLLVHVWVFGQCKWVAQCNKPILALQGSLSNFLFNCTPVLSFLSWAFAHSFVFSLSWWRQTKVTADFNFNHIKITKQGCYEQFSPCICLFHCLSLFFLIFPPYSVFLSQLSGTIPIYDSPTYSFINMRASHVWVILWKKCNSYNLSMH